MIVGAKEALDRNIMKMQLNVSIFICVSSQRVQLNYYWSSPLLAKVGAVVSLSPSSS